MQLLRDTPADGRLLHSCLRPWALNSVPFFRESSKQTPSNQRLTVIKVAQSSIMGSRRNGLLFSSSIDWFSADLESIFIARPSLLPRRSKICSLKYDMDKPGNLIQTRLELIDAMDGSGRHLLTEAGSPDPIVHVQRDPLKVTLLINWIFFDSLCPSVSTLA